MKRRAIIALIFAVGALSRGQVPFASTSSAVQPSAATLQPSGPGWQPPSRLGQTVSETPSQSMLEQGKSVVAGRAVEYQIRRLPVSSFPELPAAVAAVLEQMGCMIPQSYAARHPENVIHGSLEAEGTLDWAALCSVNGTVRLLVFFNSRPTDPILVTATTEKQRLQVHDASGMLGFGWGIDAASPERVHQAQAGLGHRPPRILHDALADTFIDHPAVYRLYDASGWKVLETSE